jgi:hypothetical protein
LCFCIAAVGFLGVVVLGALRELVIVRQELASLVAVVTEPVTPPVIQQPIPRSVARAIHLGECTHERHILAFLGERCSGCLALLRSMQAGSRVDPEDVTIVISGSGDDPVLLALSRKPQQQGAHRYRRQVDSGPQRWTDPDAFLDRCAINRCCRLLNWG